MPTIAEQWFEEGRVEGRERGELIGQIRTLQTILAREISPREFLLGQSLEKLKQMAHELSAAAKK